MGASQNQGSYTGYIYYRDHGNENGNYHLGRVYRGLYRDQGRENGNCHLGLRFYGVSQSEGYHLEDTENLGKLPCREWKRQWKLPIIL